MLHSDHHRRWGVVSDDDRFAFKILGKLLVQPSFSCVVAGNQVIRSQASISGICSDVSEVVHGCSSYRGGGDLVAS